MKSLLLLPILLLAACYSTSDTDVVQESNELSFQIGSSMSPCPDSMNPYVNPNVGPPPGPIYCPEGTSINWDCVEAAADAFQEAVDQAAADAADAWRAACFEHDNQWHACDLLRIQCLLNGNPQEVCYGAFENCVDAAAEEYANTLDSIQSDYESAVDAAVDQYWEDVSECCDAFAAMMQFPTYEVCESPYEDLVITGPQGPINCPTGVIDWDCVEDAEEAFYEAAEEARDAANAGWLAACSTYQGDVSTCNNNYTWCKSEGLPTNVCQAILNDCINAAQNARDFAELLVAEDFAEALSDATDQYWADVANCCEEF